MRIVLLVVLGCLSLPAAAEEHWFLATLGNQPFATLRQSDRELSDGRHSSTTEMLLVIKRALPGQPELRIEMRETQVFTEDHDGRILDFRFDHDENGSITSASGVVAAARVSGTFSRLGRTSPIDLPIAPGQRLIGDQASQVVLAKAGLTPGSVVNFSTLGLISNQVAIVTSTATARGRMAEDLLFDVVADVMPLPMRLRVTPTGSLAGMTMDFGMMKMELKPTAGPVALLGAELPPTGLVAAAGPAPKAAASNRLMIPAGPALPADPFQAEAAGTVTVLAEAAPTSLTAEDRATYLAPSIQLELDDADLRAWALANAGNGSMAERAERLRLAVRSHITTKDLSKGDASALETFRSRRGDCTEHATLLAAALRIAGIPARIQVGLIYAADYGGWVGHAWDQAYVDDRWIHLDSAYPGIARSCYLGLGFANGLQTGAAMMVQLNRFLGHTITVEP